MSANDYTGPPVSVTAAPTTTTSVGVPRALPNTGLDIVPLLIAGTVGLFIGLVLVLLAVRSWAFSDYDKSDW